MDEHNPLPRLFIALWPDQSVRGRLAACRNAWRWPAGARVVADAKLHLTLHYIGAFDRGRLGELDRTLATVPMAPLTLSPAGFEIWKGGIAVLRLESGAPLRALHERLAAALASLDVTLDERPFSPHTTLARKAAAATLPASPCDLAWHTDEFALVESAGGAYRVLQRYAGLVRQTAQPA